MGRAEVDTAQSSVESLKARIELAKHQVEVAQSQVAALEVDLSDMVGVRAHVDGARRAGFPLALDEADVAEAQRSVIVFEGEVGTANGSGQL